MMQFLGKNAQQHEEEKTFEQVVLQVLKVPKKKQLFTYFHYLNKPKLFYNDVE
jgi:hypothetical protein